jgi:predicted dithiol-disulfide oxidoreductase (DUF899 family)
MKPTDVVNREQWLAARKELLAKEKAFDKQRDALTRDRQAMPWVTVEKDYIFDGPDGEESLSDLFDGRSQLIVYHFMYHPDWGDEPCRSCSFWVDNLDGIIVHLNARDVSMVAVSKAKQSQLSAYRKRMGWSLKWLSSFNNDFNRDHHVSFTEEEKATENGYYNYTHQRVPRREMPGMSVFARDDEGCIYHTYSSYGRGIDMINQAWIRRHDEYGTE